MVPLSIVDSARLLTARLVSTVPSMVLWALLATVLAAGFTIPAQMPTNARTSPTVLFVLPTLNAVGVMALACLELRMDLTLPLLNVLSGSLLVPTLAAYYHALLTPIVRLAWLKDTVVIAK